MVMTTIEDGKSNTAEEMESEMEERDQARREEESGDWEDLNQGIQTGTHGSTHLGVRWGPSYRTRRTRATGSQSSDNK
jgi:hypothetical protein